MLSDHAYIGIPMILIATAFGFPMPEDILVIAAGVLAERGVIELSYAWFACYISILIADSITLYIGWHFGKAVLHRKFIKRMIHPRRVLWARRQVQEHGAWVVFAARFIPGSRLPVVLISGMMHISRVKFLIADASGLILSVSIQLALGWVFSKSIDQFMHHRTEILLGIAGIGILVLLGYTIYRYTRRNRTVTSNS